MFVYLAMAYKDSDYTIMIAEGVSLSTTNSKPEVYLKTFFLSLRKPECRNGM